MGKTPVRLDKSRIFYAPPSVHNFLLLHSLFSQLFLRKGVHRQVLHYPQPVVNNYSLLLMLAVMSRRLSCIPRAGFSSIFSTFLMAWMTDV